MVLATYGGLASALLTKLCELVPRVNFVCDTYNSPSITDIEHIGQGATDVEMAITGADQKRQKYFTCALKSTKLKMALFELLVNERQNNSYKAPLQGHV